MSSRSNIHNNNQITSLLSLIVHITRKIKRGVDTIDRRFRGIPTQQSEHTKPQIIPDNELPLHDNLETVLKNT